MKLNDSAIIALVPSADHSEKEGYFVNLVSGLAALVSATTDLPIGVILEGEGTDGQDSIALQNFGGIVSVKVVGTATAGADGQLNNDGSVKDDTSGTRVVVCRFLESGTTGALVKAVLYRPLALS